MSAILMLSGLVALLTPQLRSRAAGAAGSRGIVYQSRLPFYDIRLEKEGSLVADLYRQQQERSNLSGLRAGVKMGEANLGARVPNLSIEYTSSLGTPDLIGTKGGTKFLTAASSAARESIVRDFISTNKSLYGLSSAQIGALKTFADYTNPAGNMSFVGLKQEINGIPVFQGEVMASFTKRNELVRTINTLAPGLNYGALPTAPGISAADATASAAKNIGMDVKASDLRVESAAADGRSVVLERGPFDENTRAELMYFPLGTGAAALSWSTVLWQPDVAYWVITDAQTGQMLWRKCITNDQTQSVTYNIYNDDSPAPSSPSGANMPDTVNGFQAAAIARTDVTEINEMPTGQPYSSDPWIADGAGNVVTTGNNADAGLDIDGTNGIDAAGRATGTGRVLSFVYNPAPGIPAPGDAPTLTAYRNGIVTNIFFWTNRYHDILYQYGFTEAARNFQTNNYGRGGLGNDFVRAEAQDSSGTNNANFNTPADGSLPRMQMYIFTGPTPDRDGDIDADVFVHEMTHGTSNRLHNNGSGLTTTQGGGMGEGWSDFYARSILSSASENINGLYASGGYVTNQLSTLGNANYYYGIRRFPYALKTVLGPNNKPHNPLTFADIDTAQINTSDGAYAESPLNFSGNGANEVHNIGEIWCMMLLEVRARIITRLGYAAGNQRMLQITTDAMKLDVASPTMIQARDSIIAADNAGFGGADVNDIWAGFATRGMGYGATTSGTSTVTESFLTPNLILQLTNGSLVFSDAGGNNNGVAEPGETIALTVPLMNPLASTATGVTATIAGHTANYPDIAGGATQSQVINYTVPAATACGSVLSIPVDINSSLGPTTQNFNLTIGAPVLGFAQNFDGVVAPALPPNWTTAATGSESAWVSVTSTPVDSAPNATFAPDPTTVGNTELVSPSIAITTASAQLSFRNLFNMESSSVTQTLGYDGMVLEISIGGGAYQDILAAGGSFVSNGYNKTISGSFSSPIANRQAWSGLSGGTTSAPTYVTTTVNLPAAANGQNINLKWRAATDSSLAAAGQAGVRVDSITIQTGSTCAAVPNAYHPPYDFDGDSKSDISIWRGPEGLWAARQSSNPNGPLVQQNWGSTNLGDKIVPGDYNGDGKADFAVVRNGTWYIHPNGGGSDSAITWGFGTDIPVPADYDNDGKTDIAVWRPSDGYWYVLGSTAGFQAQQWGQNGDRPVIGDYNGDGKADFAVARPNDPVAGVLTWYVTYNGVAGSFVAQQWGLNSDKIEPGDFDGDHKADLAVFRPSDGFWYVLGSTSGFTAQQFGLSTDVPVAADYDGDGKTDRAVFRPSDTYWYILGSTSGFTAAPFGLGTDITVPSAYNR